MNTKKSALSNAVKFALPICSLAIIVGCNSGNSSNEEMVSSGLYPAGANEVVIYYKRDMAPASGTPYEGWGLHLWNGDGCNSTDLVAMNIAETGTDWNAPKLMDGISDLYGAYYVLKVDPDAADPHKCMNFILHNGDDKAFGSANSKVELLKLDESKGVFGFHGSSQFYYVPTIERPVTIDGRQAHWLDAETIAWEAAQGADKVRLFYSPTGGITMDDDKNIVGGTALDLSISGELSADRKDRFRHLASHTSIANQFSPDQLRTILKSQIVLAAYRSDGGIIAATEVQSAGVLDAVFADEAGGNAIGEQLGAIVSGSDATFKLWAPTAKDVKVELYNDDKELVATHALTEDGSTGVWSSEVISGALNAYYRYQVTVYHPVTGSVETRMVTDPYSLSLSANSRYSHVIDLDDTALMPVGWENPAPILANDVDHVLYESHIRDFSFSDTTGTPSLNGKYLALTEESRESVQHLKTLQQAGLTTLHILPAFDIATIDESKQIDITDTVGDLCEVKQSASICATENWSQTIETVLDGYDVSTGQAQALMNDLRGLDSFNWGYDPYHYTVPEGSYATDASGSVRIKEFRTMVQSAHDMGLKLVMDVVYNHTNASGVNDKSVLDKIVPGYYHRLNPNTGGVENSTCCDNTATENLMMGKLMVDSLKVWANDYKVDGFRFDLMGHQPKDLMVQALEDIRGIDPNTLFYGEGWDFGEVANNARFEQSTQINMAGTGIGTFSDRLRDAVRGGSPFDGGQDSSGNHPLRFNQGFANAAYPNEESKSDQQTLDGMLHNQDIVRLGMAGNLANYVLIDSKGMVRKGKDVDYNGAPAGYTLAPSENISYVSKHDNQTLWDNNAYKIATGTSSAERARMQTVSLSTVMLGQGIPFIHMGSELLRSKSMQRDSYDSGDWFNRVKFNGDDNNWNVGLPREDKDGANWALIKKIIADSSAQPSPTDIELTKQQFIELLQIRNDSPLFRLNSEHKVMTRVDFRNVGVDQTQGLIVMSIDDGVSAGANLDPKYDAIVVVVNASAQSQSFSIDGTENFVLHDVQANSADSTVRSAVFADSEFSVPALTTAVFVLPQVGDAQGQGLPVDNSGKDTSAIPPYGDTTVYVKGEMNGWGASDEWALSFVGNGLYQLTASLDAGDYQFKFSDADWTDPNIGCDGSSILDGSSLPLGNSGNCELSVGAQGNFTFILDASDVSAPILKVTNQ
ncbi:pullulanase-type alpha-1,6-glucosidase [Vibrio sp. ZSDZ34]|uniref:pullulanase n=1 Tax=Vibrio gelatinilyticus TaxID=2893468 RepID=A0A9X1W9V4_9VIBR|nr:pullulanase-type alpha-1,6-glucosidase [Vibrio gelatinilyticus]